MATTLQNLQTVIALAIQARVPEILWGPPGVGKTKMTYAIAKALRRRCHVRIMSGYDPADVTGYPAPDFEKKVVMMLANHSLWGRCEKMGTCTKLTCRWLHDGDVMFMDEASTLEGRQQAVMLRPVFEYVVGEYELPDVAWVAAANPPESAANGGDLSPAFANRWGHLEYTLDSQAWGEGSLRGWPDPAVPTLQAGWAELYHAQLAVIVAYTQVQPHRLLVFPKNNTTEAGRAWPSPRSWDMAAKLLAACEASGVSEDIALLAMGSCIGAGAALEFLNWRRALDLPDIEELLHEPDKFKLPKRLDQRYAVLAGVVSAVVRNTTDGRNLAAWRIFALASKQGAPDVAIPAARPLAALLKERGESLKLTPPTKTKDLDVFIPLLEKWVWRAS